MVRKLLISFVALVFLCPVSEGGLPTLDVCGLLKSPGPHNRKTVIVTGLILADRHSTGIVGDGCNEGIVIGYDVDSQPKQFVDGIEDKRQKLDPRPFKVTVEGKFSDHVRAGLGYISRIDVTRALHWKFIDGINAGNHGP
jgi:hypothetical protein